MNAIETIEILYYVYWVLILLSPIVFSIRAYLHIKKKRDEKIRKRLLTFSVFLLLLDAYQLIGSIYQRKQWEEMEKNEAVSE